MNATNINNRLKKLEQRLSPADDGTFTLEEICRAMWHEDKGKLLELAKGSTLTLFVRQFEFEDVERGGDRSRTRRQE